MQTWYEVIKKHKSQGGVYTKQGKVVSILISKKEDPLYKNTFENDSITYHITNKHVGKGWILKFKDAINHQYPITVYRKYAPNKWENEGQFVVKKIIKENAENSYFFLIRY